MNLRAAGGDAGPALDEIEAMSGGPGAIILTIDATSEEYHVLKVSIGHMNKGGQA